MKYGDGTAKSDLGAIEQRVVDFVSKRTEVTGKTIGMRVVEGYSGSIHC